MRIDLTLRAPDGTGRDVAVLAPAGTPQAQLTSLLAGYAAAGARLRPGAVLSASEGRGSADHAGGHDSHFTATHRLDVVGGPDSGRSVSLAREALSIGRAAGCDLVLHDPGVSRVHADVALTVHGPTVRDRSSANGTTVDGTIADAAGVPVRTGHYVRLGDTFLAVSAARSPAAVTRTEADGTTLVNRPPHPAGPPQAEQIDTPTPPAVTHKQRISWLAALVPAAAGVGLAVSLHAPQFLLFALLSPIALLATAFGDRLHWRRDRRRELARYRSELAASDRRVAGALARETKSRRARDPDPATVLHTAGLPGARLWERPREGPGLLRVRVGLGDAPSYALVKRDAETTPAGTVHAVPVTVDLATGPLGVCGPRDVALAVARWVIGQLATHSSPADLELALVLSGSAEPAWHWVRWLPHLRSRVAVDPDEQRALVSELQELGRQRSSASGSGTRWSGAWVLVVVDECVELADVAGLSELLIHGGPVGITALCIDARHGGLPAGAVTLARVCGETGSRLTLADSSGEQTAVADQVDAEWADKLARSLAPLRDPGPGPIDSIPDRCQLLPLLALSEPTAESVLGSWQIERPGLCTPLGVSTDGPLSVDLVRDGPHALVAGTTGSGKSELLRSLVAGLAARHPPESVAFVLIDYKGGAAFAECARLPHTVGIVTDLDTHLAERALQSLERELTRREEVFAACGADGVDSYRLLRPDKPVPRLVIVIDEFAELAAELGEFVSGLVGIARRGRSLGVHLVLATQRPGGVVSPEIRANTALRIALRVTDPAESRDVVDADAAAAIGRHRPGRAYLRLPGAPLVSLQTAHVGASSAVPSTEPRVLPLDQWRRLPPPRADSVSASTDLQLLVTAAEAAAVRSGRPPPHRPWLAPLPERIALSSLQTHADYAKANPDAVPADPGATVQIPMGLCDLPRAQQQLPFSLDLRAGGSVLFAGGPRSGRTSAVLTLAIAATTELPPDQLHLYTVDCAGGGLAPLAQLPHCGSLVGSDSISTATFIARLEREVNTRRAILAQDPKASLPMLLWVLDGWDSFAAAADEHDTGRTVDTVCALLRAAPSAQMTVAITGDRAALAVRLSSAVGTKLMLKLTDRADYGLVGLSDRAVPASLPPGRAVRAEDGVEIQLAHLGSDPSRAERDAALRRAVSAWTGADTGTRPLLRVRPLPERVRLADLPPRAPAETGVVLGVGGDAGLPLSVDLFAGTGRLLVAGPPRSGRSTVLSVLLAQLLAADCRVVLAAPTRSPLTALANTYQLPLVTPDRRLQTPPDSGHTVLLVDDSESFLDTPAGDALTDWIRAAATGFAVVATGSSDELAVTFRGLGAEVRRSRCAVLLHPGPGDAELAGCPLPRRRASGPPGRGLLIGDPAWGPAFTAGPVPIQIAQP